MEDGVIAEEAGITPSAVDQECNQKPPACSTASIQELPPAVLQKVLRTLLKINPWGPANQLLPLRLVSRAFRNAVDEVAETFTCRFGNKQKSSNPVLFLRACKSRNQLFSRWPNLKELRLHFFWSHAFLQANVEAVALSPAGSRLQALDISYFRSAVGLAEQCDLCFSAEALSALQGLKSLSLFGLPLNSRWYQGLSCLGSLRDLEIVECRSNSEVALELPDQLQRLRISGGTVCIWMDRPVMRLHVLLLGSKIERLTINCLRLTEQLLLPKSLQSLSLTWTQAAGLGQGCDLPNLETLDMNHCDIQLLPPLDRCLRLQSLRLEHMGGPLAIPYESLCRLEHLHLISLPELQPVSGITQLTSLKTLDVTECLQNEILDAIPLLCSLQTLQLVGTGDSVNEGGLGPHFNFHFSSWSSLTGLTSLSLEDFVYTGEIPDYESCPSLTSLYLENMQNMLFPCFYSPPRTLEYLNISACPRLHRLNLSRLTNLKTICLNHNSVSLPRSRGLHRTS